MTKPPHYGGRLAGEPMPPPDNYHLWPRPTALLTRCVEGTQACDERAWVAAAVRVVLANERSAPRFVRRFPGHLLIRAIAATSSMVTLTVAPRRPAWPRRAAITWRWISRATW
jgi:hypothetical protein